MRRLGQMICKVLSRSNFWIKQRAPSWRKQPKRPGREWVKPPLPPCAPPLAVQGKHSGPRPTLPLAGRRVQARGRCPHSPGTGFCDPEHLLLWLAGCPTASLTAARLPTPHNPPTPASSPPLLHFFIKVHILESPWLGPDDQASR